MVRSTGIAKFGNWLEESDLNLLTFKILYDVLLLLVWLIVMMVKVTSANRALCPVEWSEDRCNEFAADSYGTIFLSFVVPILCFGLVFLDLRSRYRQNHQRAIEIFHIESIIHIYLNLVFLLVIISVHGWVVLFFWIIGFLQDLFVFMRIHATRASSAPFPGFFDM
eukprot:c24358_g1_i1.p1 GENE.c24358_g1_i1~~c24358_g1_i1.p1  ORF type:complete len:176 (+),score=27.93 c24358_g1_i1:33-530(+)